jgi:Ca2+:H+ antiporter
MALERLDLGQTAPFWSWAAPVAAWAALAVFGLHVVGTASALLLAALLLPAVLAAVHHAEVIAVKVGEPFGTLVLALAVTVIECALIITLMLAKPEESAGLLRDTVYSAVMIILGGVVGICIAVGAVRHHVQRFGLHGVSAATTALAALAVLVLVLPNFTTTTFGPTFSQPQLFLVGAASLAVWLLFVFVQTVRHRDYFLPDEEERHIDSHVVAENVTAMQGWLALAMLMACLGGVVLLAKALSDPLAALIVRSGAPLSAVGVVIAGVVLLPECVAALRAARADRLQTSLNLALGSALATIGLTVPVIATLSVIFGWRLELGLDPKGITLLALMLLVSAMSLATGRTTVLQGGVHLVVFVFFLFTSFSP